jgi:hypothetical protein
MVAMADLPERSESIKASDDHFISLPEFARRIDVSASWAARLARLHLIPATRLPGGRRWKISKRFTDTFVQTKINSWKR